MYNVNILTSKLIIRPHIIDLNLDIHMLLITGGSYQDHIADCLHNRSDQHTDIVA